MIGRTISHYRILEQLGEGGMGAVYRAEDERLKRHVALKFLRGESLESAEHKRRFLHEARAAAALDHPHICGIYEIEDDGDRLFMVMPLLEGKSLDKRLADGPLPLTEAVDIAIQTAEALEEAHRKEIIHRDIKTGNIMVRDRGRSRVHATLMDFGLARLSQATKLTREGSALGTAAYMSPEQATGEDIDARTDVWSLGVVLYEMVIGRTPFRADYEQALFYAILNEQAAPMTSLRTGVPMELERIVNKCMAKSPDERYPSMAGLLVDLHALRKDITGDSRGRTTAMTVVGKPAAAPDQVEHVVATLPWYRKFIPLLWGALAVGAIVPIAVIALLESGADRSAPKPAWNPADLHVRQLTREPGLAATPSFSPDGQLVVYSADEQGNGDLDVWVQQITGGSRVQLTRHASLDVYPSFSPDGSTVLFTSMRDGGGIYTIPALGGVPRLLSDEAGIARYSPDGDTVAFATGRAGLFVVPAEGGEPRKVSTDFSRVSCFLWLPEGDGFLLRGDKEGDDTDWWTVDLDDGEAQSTGAQEWFATLPMRPGCPSAIDPDDGSVLAMAFSSGGSNIWRFGFDPRRGKILETYERVTFGAGFEEYPAISSDGRIAYFDAELEFDLWKVPLERAGAEIEPLTTTDSLEFRPSSNVAGRHVAFVGFDFAQPDVFVLDTETGEKRAVTQDASAVSSAVLSPDASSVAYDAGRDDSRSVWVSPRRGGLARKLCEDCGTPRAWLPDGKTLVLENGVPRRIEQITLDEPKPRTLVARTGYDLSAPDISPDGKWIAFGADQPGSSETEGIYIAPLAPGESVDEADWTPVAPGVDSDTPRFSPDGRMLYFRSERDDFVCLWRIRLDRRTGEPIGDPEAVYHFHSLGRSLGNVDVENFDMSVTSDSVILPLNAVFGNIWVIEPAPGD